MPNKTQIKQASIVFSPSGKRGSVPVGTPVLQAARELGVDIDSICGGHARCGRCQVHQQVVRKDFEARHIEIDPLTRLYFTSVAEPDLQYPDGDLQRLLSALEQEWDLSGLDCDIHVLQTLQSALRAGEWQVNVLHPEPLNA
jgi:uncharacterized 2Fe-2S/4Fe-4S cluster protein (DUF4445 family)